MDCTGGKFYIWGGNPGLQRLIEDGLYNLSASSPAAAASTLH